VADCNGDGAKTSSIGGAFKQPGKLFIQQPNGASPGKNLVTGVKYERICKAFSSTADGDKDPELSVVQRQHRIDLQSPYYRPRLYLNDGKGNFPSRQHCLPPISSPTPKALAIADLDGDGDKDISSAAAWRLGISGVSPKLYPQKRSR